MNTKFTSKKEIFTATRSRRAVNDMHLTYNLKTSSNFSDFFSTLRKLATFMRDIIIFTNCLLTAGQWPTLKTHALYT